MVIRHNKNVLFLTDDSASPVCLRVLVSDFKDNRENQKNDDLSKFN